ncbi:hypothetical protein [Photobacterium damselae]|uniref:hypothetical protein n=1 Tax=Photobacterium damselae TaxID=38293 RepID=UPI000D666D72|nr:hypothetical protein [Photobacterium damselae]AWK83824.1 hypothetical protein BST98_17605 [Photobacterium damselae]
MTEYNFMFLTDEFGWATASKLTAYSTLAVENMSPSSKKDSINYSKAFTYPSLPDGAVLIANAVYTQQFEGSGEEYDHRYQYGADVTVNGTTVTVHGWADYSNYLRWLHIELRVYVDFSGVPKGMFGMQFSQNGVYEALTSNDTPLCLKQRWKGVFNEGQTHITVSTNIPYTTRRNVYIGLSTDDTFRVTVDNQDGMMQIQINRDINCWKCTSRSLYSLTQCDVYLLIYAPWNGKLPQYGFAIYKSDGEPAWASNELPESVSGYIEQPSIISSNQNSLDQQQEQFCVNYHFVDPAHRDEIILFNSLSRGDLITGDYVKHSIANLYYNRGEGKLSLAIKPELQSGEFVVQGKPQQSNTLRVRVPYILARDHF